MKILVINGSPKREQSDTMHITRAFLDGFQTAVPGAEVEVIHAIDCHIAYCTGCFTCMNNGGECRIDDDMRPILQKILASDVLIFSFPLYCYGMPAPLKALVDRILPLSSMKMEKSGGRYAHAIQANCTHLRCVMLCGCGFPNSKQNFEPAVAQFRLLFPANHTIITIPESPMFSAPEASCVTVPKLEAVKLAGMQYGATGEIDGVLSEELTAPMIPEDEYVRIVNGQI